MTLIESQLVDALAFVKGLGEVISGLPDTPDWGDGLHLRLPPVIPLYTDYAEDKTPAAWLVANDFDGYDLATEEPKR